MRYWDGNRWTEHRHDPEPTAHPTSATPSPPGPPGNDSLTNQPNGSPAKALFVGALAIGAAVVVAAVVVAGLDTDLRTEPALGPEGQSAFLRIVEDGQEADTSNEIQVVEAKRERSSALCDLLPSNLRVERWTGTVDEVRTGTGLDGGVLTLLIADGVKVSTGGGALGADDDRLIDPSSELFSRVGSLEVGQEVTFSGEFEADSEQCIGEDSLLDSNGLRTPTFLITFSAVGR